MRQFFIKTFSKLEYAESFLSKGQMLFRNFKYFREGRRYSRQGTFRKESRNKSLTKMNKRRWSDDVYS